nr:ribonuclease H-like domain-containing protein [Tanacetum cinerariifolium]
MWVLHLPTYKCLNSWERWVIRLFRYILKPSLSNGILHGVLAPGTTTELVYGELGSLGVALDWVLLMLPLSCSTSKLIAIVVAISKLSYISSLTCSSAIVSVGTLVRVVSHASNINLKPAVEDLNIKFLRSLPSERNTHVVVWRNKSDLDTMSIDDLYNNFKIVKQEVKGTTSLNSSSQNMAFVSSFSTNSTNKVHIAYEVSIAGTPPSTASTQVNTPSSQTSTANLSDATVYALLANQSNRSQLVHEDLEQIHRDDLEEMNLKWKLALLSMRAKRIFQKTRKKIIINGSDTAGLINPKYQESSRRTVHVEETPPKAMVAIDGVGFNWSYMAEDETPINIALMAFSDSEKSNLSFTKGMRSLNGPSLKAIDLSLVKKESKNASKDIPNELKESPNAPLVKNRVSKNKYYPLESPVVVEKKTNVPTNAIFEVVRPKQQEKLVRKPVKYVEMYMSQAPKGNQRNWNNLKSQQLGSNFVMYNKSYFVCGSFKHVQANYNYHQKERVVSRNNFIRVNYNNYTKKNHPNAHRNIAPKAVSGLRALNTARVIYKWCKKQTVVATSTTEVEYVAAASCCE